ncbi:MAG: cupin domain-containing protein [Desulfobulbaceae bacterium]|nr:cupin domain-containing protein [Desulfobulbaceae bacterium]
MQTRFFPQREMIFTNHPKFENVKAAMFITGEESSTACVCMIEIAPGSEIPIHTHETETDSIFVVQGGGEAYVNGTWRTIEAGDYLYIPAKGEHGTRNTGAVPLRLFVHRSALLA